MHLLSGLSFYLQVEGTEDEQQNLILLGALTNLKADNVPIREEMLCSICRAVSASLSSKAFVKKRQKPAAFSSSALNYQSMLSQKII